MAAVHEEDRLAAAEAGTAGSSAAEQKASIKNALNTPTDPEDIIISVSCLVTAHCAESAGLTQRISSFPQVVLSQLIVLSLQD